MGIKRIQREFRAGENTRSDSEIKCSRAETHWSWSRAFNSQPRETHSTARSSKFEVWSFANFHFGWEIICKRLISLLVHLSRCPLSILSQFQSKMIVCETSNFTAKLQTSNFLLRAVCFARLRFERAQPISVCLRPYACDINIIMCH